MKKRISIVLCVVMLLSLVLTGCSKTFQVETDLTDLKLKGETEIKGGEDYAATLAPKDDFLLPEEITVKIDGSKLSDKKYTYDAETGEILIPGDEITGDIEIIAEGMELTLVGKWVGTVDMTDMFNQIVAGSDPLMKEHFQFEDISFQLCLEFGDDDIASMYVDNDSVADLAVRLKDQLMTNTYNYLDAMIAEEGFDMSVDELLALQGYTLESFIDENFDVEDLMSGFVDISETGSYLAEDGILYIADRVDVAADSTEGNPYTLESDTLTIMGTGDESEYEAFMYPLVMKRVG